MPGHEGNRAALKRVQSGRLLVGERVIGFARHNRNYGCSLGTPVRQRAKSHAAEPLESEIGRFRI